MKSVIAQASSLAKAVNEAWEKAGKPGEFFIKVLQEASSGFLGFGSKKAKVALFFKQLHKNQKHEKSLDILKQREYESLFNNKKLKLDSDDQPSAPQHKNQKKPKHNHQPSKHKKDVEHKKHQAKQPQGGVQKAENKTQNNMPSKNQQTRKPVNSQQKQQDKKVVQHNQNKQHRPKQEGPQVKKVEASKPQTEKKQQPFKPRNKDAKQGEKRFVKKTSPETPKRERGNVSKPVRIRSISADKSDVVQNIDTNAKPQEAATDKPQKRRNFRRRRPVAKKQKPES